jgi:hypothetical protein
LDIIIWTAFGPNFLIPICHHFYPLAHPICHNSILDVAYNCESCIIKINWHTKMPKFLDAIFMHDFLLVPINASISAQDGNI